MFYILTGPINSLIEQLSEINMPAYLIIPKFVFREVVAQLEKVKGDVLDKVDEATMLQDLMSRKDEEVNATKVSRIRLNDLFISLLMFREPLNKSSTQWKERLKNKRLNLVDK